MPNPPSFSFQNISRLDPDRCREMFETGVIKDTADCLGLVTFAIGDSGIDSNEPWEPKWIELALDVYQYLSDQNPGTYTFVLSAMMLRARVIVRYGDQPESAYFSAKIMYDWVRVNLPEMNVLLEMMRAPRELEGIRSLRIIKNKLSVLLVLLQSKDIQIPDDLVDYLPLRKQLP